MLNEKKITWCENWLKKTYEKHPFPGGGIERNLLFEMAAKAGLYTPNTYGSEFSTAIGNVGLKVETICDENGDFLYHSFKL